MELRPVTGPAGQAGEDARFGNVDLRLLEPFVVLSEELHFGRAAARLHVTQSALSQQLQRLERQLGTRLVLRAPRVALAPAGEVFLEGARDALASVARAVLEAQRMAAVQTTLRIGVDIDLPAAVLEQLRAYGASRPHRLVRLTIAQQDDVLQALEEGRVDLAVGWTAPPSGDVSLGHQVLTAVELAAVVRSNDEAAVAGCLARDELCRRTVAMYRPTRETRAFYDFFLDAMTDGRGRRPQVVHVPVLDDAQAAMLDLVGTSCDVTICVRGDLARRARLDLVEVPFDPPLTTEVVVMWRGSRRPDDVTDLNGHMRPPGAVASPA